MNTPPPSPLSEEEFKRCYKPGMSLFEVDPKLAKWYQDNKRAQLFQVIAIVIGVGVVGLILIAIVCSK